MASLLRQIVAGPRSRHPEAGLDLCYVTDNIIATSGPSSTYPQRAYRNPTDALVKFLDYRHDKDWAIWEFRAEGTGYPDSEVYHRIHHYPWPDHHPPPFALIPNIMASMRDWLKDPQSGKERVVVVHCKAGKGRSGTIACSYLISQEGWEIEAALTRFTARRMRSGFGNGVSIPSQLRWVQYVDWWSKHGKIYAENEIEIIELHIWGLRDGVKVAIEGYIEEGKTIKTFHTFSKHEKTYMDVVANKGRSPATSPDHPNKNSSPLEECHADSSESTISGVTEATFASEPGASAVVFRPAQPIIVPTPDINIDFERRNKATYGLTMVTSVAHVWFNTFFESQTSHGLSTDFTKIASGSTDTPEISTVLNSGVFEITWEAMDGIKGSARKGTRALDRLAVVWRAVQNRKEGLTNIITEPTIGELVPESKPADWTKANQEGNSTLGKDLGLRTDSPSSANVSRASSMMNVDTAPSKTPDLFEASVQRHIPAHENNMMNPDQPTTCISEPSSMEKVSPDAGGDGPALDLDCKR